LSELKKSDLNKIEPSKEWVKQSESVIVNEKCVIASIMINKIPRKEFEEFIMPCFSLFKNKKLLFKLIKETSSIEIADTVAVTDLFNSNINNFGKFIYSYCMMVAKDYISQLVTPVINSILEQHFDWKDNSIESQNIIFNIFENFLLQIYSSIEKIPLNLKKICTIVHNLVLKCFPSSMRFLVPSQILFDKIICSCLVSPSEYVSSDKDLSNHRESFIFLSKIMKSFASSCTDESKGISLRSSLSLSVDPVNEEIKSISKKYLENTLSFLSHLVSLEENLEFEEQEESIDENDLQKFLLIIMRIIRKLPNFTRDIGVILNVLPRTPQDFKDLI
jgi:hypothetical protein